MDQTKVLLVDDDQGNVALLKKHLTDAGFHVASAINGQEGLLKIQSVKPDVVILDVEMPQMNGYTFMNELQAMEQYKTTPVIVLTAHNEMQPIFQLKGVKGYLTKPIKTDELVKKIQDCLKT